MSDVFVFTGSVSPRLCVRHLSWLARLVYEQNEPQTRFTDSKRRGLAGCLFTGEERVGVQWKGK